MTGYRDLSAKPAQSLPVSVSSANPTYSDKIISNGGNSGKVSRWDDLYCEYSNLLEASGFLVKYQIKHCIDLLNPNLPVKHCRQYYMSPTELKEVYSQLDALLEKGWI